MAKKKDKIKVSCLRCGKERFVNESVVKIGSGKYCSRKCLTISNWAKPGYREYMSKAHKGQIPTNIEQLIAYARSEEGRKKAAERSKIMFAGEKNYRWVKDRSKLSCRPRVGSEYRWWRENVLKRDNYKCRIADENCKGRMEAHHILQWSKYPELRYDVNNGIILCHYHHPKTRETENKLSPYFQELVNQIQK